MRKNETTLLKDTFLKISQLFVVLLLFFQTPLFANVSCTMACEDMTIVGVGDNCLANIQWSTIDEASVCDPPFEVTVETIFGEIIASDLEFVEFPATDLIGELLQVTLTDPDSGNSCWGHLVLQDEQNPEISSCPDVTISCTASTEPDDLPEIEAADNCTTLDTNYVDTVIGPDCLSSGDVIKVIERRWTVEDFYGNVSDTCTQTISIERPDFPVVGDPGDIVWPPDNFPCDIESNQPEHTGYPTIDGHPILPGNNCEIIVTILGETVFDTTVNNGLRLIRTWQVVTHCPTTMIFTHDQSIIVSDSEPPVIDCESEIFISTDPDECFATIELEGPESITDNCSTDFDIFFFNPLINATQSITDPPYIAPVGTHTITYIVADENGLETTCEVDIIVEDTQPPAAVCDEFTVVALTSNGEAVVPAFNFDNGSYDNCGPVHFLASRDGAPFEPNITFYCGDAIADTNVMVILRAVEFLNDMNFNDCMIEVNVQDKLPPLLICPDDVTIDCEDDFSDLSVYGAPTPYDNCVSSVVISEDSDIDIAMCGTGTITREFTGTDGVGLVGLCTQVITVNNLTPFQGSSITWPLDTTIMDECPEPNELDPEDLDPGYNEPVIDNASCAMIAESYTNQFFDIDFPACYKIVRDWTLIDWCQYDPVNNPGVGIWKHQQVIKIKDTTPPIITACAAVQMVGTVDVNCQFAEVTMSELDLDIDCNSEEELHISNNSLYATSNTDASGQYPIGTHTVAFQVQDGCGNKSSCSTTIIVADNRKPVAFCKTGTTRNLELNGLDLNITVFAEDLDDDSFDHCVDQDQLTFTIQLHDPNVPNSSPPPITATSMVFDCNYMGDNVVEIWVTDQNDNSSKCAFNPIINIQDTGDKCDDPLIASITGEIKNEMGYEVEDVMVHVEGSNAFPDTTGFGGSFAFPSIPLGFNYTVMPEKDMHPLNGVTTYDMVLISKHVLNVKKLDSPYKIIAADVNKSGTVTTLDIVELRKLILMINDDFPNNKSWRFVEKTHQFSNPEDPFNSAFPETLEVENFNQDELEANFTGIKVGDVNNTALPNSLMNSDDRSELDDLVFVVENQEVKSGEFIAIDFKLQELTTLLGYQFTLNFDPTALEFIEIAERNTSKLTEDNFGLSFLDEGVITASWFDLNRVSFEEETPLFTLVFRAKMKATISDLIEINSSYTAAEAYDENEALLNVQLEFENPYPMDTNLKSTFELYQNQPNPFKKETLIRFRLPEATEGRLTIYDLSGKVLKSINQEFGKGYNELNIEKSDLNGTGVLYYQLETPDYTATKKMILLN